VSGEIDWNVPKGLRADDRGADLADELRTAATGIREEMRDGEDNTAAYERAGLLDEAADVVEWAGDQIEARNPTQPVPGNSGGVEEGR